MIMLRNHRKQKQDRQTMTGTTDTGYLYLDIKRQKTTRHEPELRGKRYKDDVRDMIINR